MNGKNTMSIYDLTKKPIAWIDLTTYCNAGCPQCHRTNPNGLGKVDWLPLIQWKFEEFKQAWPIESLNTISKFEICGTWGDPIMVKDIYKICEYVINESDVFIQMNTNGGMRDTDFWWDMGLLGNISKLHRFLLTSHCLLISIDFYYHQFHFLSSYKRRYCLLRLSHGFDVFC